MDDIGGLNKLGLWNRTLMVRDRSGLKGYRAYLGFIYDGIKV